MKKVLLLLSGLIISANVFAQGTILGFYTVPATPSVNDPVKVIANVSFTSGGCELSEQGQSTNGNRTDAYAHHCVGMLAVICNTTDTFELGTLPAGNHEFILTLTSGGAPAPCTPGIVIDDSDSITFTVEPGVGIQSPGTNALDFSLYPNPASNTIVIECGLRIGDCELKITNAVGQVVFQSEIINPKSEIDISSLITGLYHLTLESDDGVAAKRFEVIR